MLMTKPMSSRTVVTAAYWKKKPSCSGRCSATWNGTAANASTAANSRAGGGTGPPAGSSEGEPPMLRKIASAASMGWRAVIGSSSPETGARPRWAAGRTAGLRELSFEQLLPDTSEHAPGPGRGLGIQNQLADLLVVLRGMHGGVH